MLVLGVDFILGGVLLGYKFVFLTLSPVMETFSWRDIVYLLARIVLGKRVTLACLLRQLLCVFQVVSVYLDMDLSVMVIFHVRIL